MYVSVQVLGSLGKLSEDDMEFAFIMVLTPCVIYFSSFTPVAFNTSDKKPKRCGETSVPAGGWRV